MDTLWKESNLAEADALTVSQKVREIIVHNDDVNTFEHVIVSLMEICDHEPMQAEQCAWLVHYTGKCSVKRGTYRTLRPMCEALCERGLSADIQ
ncbi:MAG TPA: ATP-dependent Clp protease adaptor ClpS [Flavobacteriales bacterium]|nr:ATP-dependent Clp protease adaptor ClpS [Flavobacteriales bacterium]